LRATKNEKLSIEMSTATVTLQQFSQMIPTNREPATWHPIALDLFPRYEINTVNRIAGFMAQTAHESGDFRILEENLNYSVDDLNRVFPRYFGPGKRNATEYARNPQKLANYVYMDQFRSRTAALGNTQPGDGWRFRGGGIKQLTGRNNFTRFGASVGMAAEAAADYVRTRRGAFESACWFWKTSNLARFADRDDIEGMSRAVNGGTIGLADRVQRYARAKATLQAPSQTNDQVRVPPLSRGSRGDVVRRVQAALGLRADGEFGPATEAAIRAWQRNNKYTVNGILETTQLNQLLK
jgi:putative chitinase